MSSVSEQEAYYSERASEYEDSVGYGKPSYAAVMAPIRARYQLALRGHDVLELACGPGYWTDAVSLTARTVLATDLDTELVKMVRERFASRPNVSTQSANAYELETITGNFTAAFAQYFWSHVPKAKLRTFLKTLHSKLVPGALVMFLDNLPYFSNRRMDEAGDLLEERFLRNGTRYEVIKNFPTESEILGVLSGISEQVIYKQFRSEDYWTLSYRTA
jgi:SAM-dependent methyltransferase